MVGNHEAHSEERVAGCLSAIKVNTGTNIMNTMDAKGANHSKPSIVNRNYYRQKI